MGSKSSRVSCRPNCRQHAVANTKFIIEFHKEQTRAGVNDNLKRILSRSPKRLVWVSLVGLFRTYKQCPMALLLPSICILPIKSEWLYHPKKYEEEMRASVIGQYSLFHDEKAMQEFLQLLRFKDQQNLLFCCLDHEQTVSAELRMASFWIHFSDSLVALKLNGLDSLYCVNPDKFESKYDVAYSSILKELLFMQMEFKSMQEVIYQSNPDSLEPIVAYSSTMWESKEPTTLFLPSKLDEHENSVWWISADYEQ